VVDINHKVKVNLARNLLFVYKQQLEITKTYSYCCWRSNIEGKTRV